MKKELTYERRDETITTTPMWPVQHSVCLPLYAHMLAALPHAVRLATCTCRFVPTCQSQQKKAIHARSNTTYRSHDSSVGAGGTKPQFMRQYSASSTDDTPRALYNRVTGSPRSMSCRALRYTHGSSNAALLTFSRPHTAVCAGALAAVMDRVAVGRKLCAQKSMMGYMVSPPRHRPPRVTVPWK